MRSIVITRMLWNKFSKLISVEKFSTRFIFNISLRFSFSLLYKYLKYIPFKQQPQYSICFKQINDDTCVACFKENKDSIQHLVK